MKKWAKQQVCKWGNPSQWWKLLHLIKYCIWVQFWGTCTMSFCFAATFHIPNTFQRDITSSLLLCVYLTVFSYFLPDKDFTQEISNTLTKYNTLLKNTPKVPKRVVTPYKTSVCGWGLLSCFRCVSTVWRTIKETFLVSFKELFEPQRGWIVQSKKNWLKPDFLHTDVSLTTANNVIYNNTLPGAIFLSNKCLYFETLITLCC